MIILLTGIPGAGKTITGTILREFLHEDGHRSVLLDGDTMREISGNKFGFGGRARKQRVLELAKVASRMEGYVICALIAPTEDMRKAFRKIAEKVGSFILVYLSAPKSVCRKRKPKLYARATKGELGDYAGITSPYEIPKDADLTIKTANKTPEQVARIIEKLITSL